MDILLGKEICRDLDQAASREWLETNGIGGFAASTVVGMNTRRYHGLLVAAAHPPLGRFVALSLLQETVSFAGHRFELGCNRYPDAIHPQGYRYVEHFRRDPFPVISYRLADLQIEKRVFMVHGENTTVIRYGPVDRPIRLEVRPLIAFRDYHNLTHSNDAIRRQAETLPGRIRLSPYPGLPSMDIAYADATYHPDAQWNYSFVYPVEVERGLDSREDLFSPGFLEFDVPPGRTVDLIASLGAHEAEDAGALEDAEKRRRSRLVARIPAADSLARDLTRAADDFIARRGDSLATVIAGYPWFGDWGRDTMIALPGLTLVTGRFDEARSILRAFAEVCDGGMIPNRFPDHGETPDYNSVDASLWYIHAVGRYLAYTGDLAFVRTAVWPVVKAILKAFHRGTRYGIRVDDDGLLRAGEPGVQLTWMDAKVGDWVVTPRSGKPVEINALWHHALRVAERLGRAFGEPDAAARAAALAARAAAAFGPAFWNGQEECLYDVVDDDFRDGSVRPNQIFAISLPDRLLPEDRERCVLARVEHDLLTPCGLRSLSPRDSAYCPRYEGDPRARDGAYHQGTVWSWLLGPYVTAWVRLNGGPAVAGARARGHLLGLVRHLYEAGLGQISEVFDGDPPHAPRGCFAQAWSVAECLRAYVEDIQGIRPGKWAVKEKAAS